MINLDEDALICDLAETYQIYDYRSLPLKLVATLSAGLRDDSRIMMLATGAPATQQTLLLATIADRVAMFQYGFSSDASKGMNRPASLVEAIFGESVKSKKGVTSFRTAKDFEAALAQIKGE